MLAAIHNNANIDAEQTNDRVVERISAQKSRANDAPSYRMKKNINNKVY